MLVEEVKQLKPLDRFVYWVKERHQIHLRRKNGRPKPWTDDEVLQNFFFTNPYRENDKVTVFIKDKVREPLRDDPKVVLAIIIARWFNWPDTIDVLLGKGGMKSKDNMLTHWNMKEVLARLEPIQDEGGKIFTGAYLVNSPGRIKKLQAVCKRIDRVWRDREHLTEQLTSEHNGEPLTLQQAHNIMISGDYPGLGSFSAYEVVCDLRYTFVLENASDILTWSNPGPGATRGICRLLDRHFTKGKNKNSPPKQKDYQEQSAKLLATLTKRLPRMPAFEMREVEHSLCEWDKYERLLWGDGQARRGYNGVSDSEPPKRRATRGTTPACPTCGRKYRNRPKKSDIGEGGDIPNGDIGVGGDITQGDIGVDGDMTYDVDGNEV